MTRLQFGVLGIAQAFTGGMVFGLGVLGIILNGPVVVIVAGLLSPLMLTLSYQNVSRLTRSGSEPKGDTP